MIRGFASESAQHGEEKFRRSDVNIDEWLWVFIQGETRRAPEK